MNDERKFIHGTLTLAHEHLRVHAQRQMHTVHTLPSYTCISRERDRDKERQTDRQRDRDRERQRLRGTDRERERDRYRDRERQRQRDIDRQRQRDRVNPKALIRTVSRNTHVYL